MKKLLVLFLSISSMTHAQIPLQKVEAFYLNGNSNSSEKFLGTKNNYDLPIRTNNVERMRISNGGFIGVNQAPDANNMFSITAKAGVTGLYLTSTNNAPEIIISKTTPGGMRISTSYPSIDMKVLGSSSLFFGSPAYGYNTIETVDMLYFKNYSSGAINFTIKDNGHISAPRLPHDSTGLTTGEVWIQGGLFHYKY